MRIFQEILCLEENPKFGGAELEHPPFSVYPVRHHTNLAKARSTSRVLSLCSKSYVTEIVDIKKKVIYTVLGTKCSIFEVPECPAEEEIVPRHEGYNFKELFKSIKTFETMINPILKSFTKFIV